MAPALDELLLGGGLSFQHAFRIHDIGTAILRPGFFAVTKCNGLFLAKRNGLDAAAGNTKQLQTLQHGFRALLSKRKVVFTAAAFFGLSSSCTV